MAVLDHITDFPFAGSTAFLRGTAEQCRIIRHNGDGTALISLPGRQFHSERASGNRTVDLADLYKSAEEAMFCGRKQRRGRRG
jgi:hypothetical protein